MFDPVVHLVTWDFVEINLGHLFRAGCIPSFWDLWEPKKKTKKKIDVSRFTERYGVGENEIVLLNVGMTFLMVLKVWNLPLFCFSSSLFFAPPPTHTHALCPTPFFFFSFGFAFSPTIERFCLRHLKIKESKFWSQVLHESGFFFFFFLLKPTSN